MARTPLFSLVRRSLRLANASLDVPQDAAALVEERRERAVVSRRDFLRSTAAVSTVAALDACVRPRRTGGVTAGGQPVIVVGAGIAGLTTAYRLRQAGVPVRVIEAQGRIGGRMFSLRNFFADGQVCELGGELIDTPHTHIQALAGELGIQLDDLSTDDPSLAHDVWYFGGARRTDAEVVEAFRPIAERIRSDLATVSDPDTISYRSPNNAESLDRMSLAAWLDRAGVSGWVRSLLDVAYTTEYGLEPQAQSTLNLLLMIELAGNEFRIFGESDERYHVRGGNDLITSALAKRLGDAIETGQVLESVSPRPDGSFELSVRRGSTSVAMQAPHVVLAIPFTLLRDVRLNVDLPPVKRRAIAELGYGTNAKLMVGFNERVWRTRHRSNGSVLTDLPFQLTWETSRLQAGRSGILTNFTGGAHGVALGQGTPAEQAAKLADDLDRILPGVAAARVGMKEARFHWPSFPWTRGSYASYLAGQWTGLAGAEREPVGNLHFAGEHCSRDAQGFIEGGCEAGEAAASEILSAMGVRRDASRTPARRAALRAWALRGAGELAEAIPA